MVKVALMPVGTIWTMIDMQLEMELAMSMSLDKKSQQLESMAMNQGRVWASLGFCSH